VNTVPGLVSCLVYPGLPQKDARWVSGDGAPPWEIFMDGVRKLSDDFMAERRQPKLETRQR
jgi:hypothetical protein